MDVTPLLRADQKIVQAYAAGKFKISGVHYDGPVIVTSFDVESWTEPNIAAMSPSDFAKFIGEIDVLLIGTGKTGLLFPPQKRAEFREAGLPVELMDTGAACRTFNVLTAEGRRVAAALIPV